MSAGHPTRRISFKLSEIDVHFSQEQDVYFLCVKFRIDTSENMSPGCPGKYIRLNGVAV